MYLRISFFALRQTFLEGRSKTWSAVGCLMELYKKKETFIELIRAASSDWGIDETLIEKDFFLMRHLQLKSILGFYIITFAPFGAQTPARMVEW